MENDGHLEFHGAMVVTAEWLRRGLASLRSAIPDANWVGTTGSTDVGLRKCEKPEDVLIQANTRSDLLFNVTLEGRRHQAFVKLVVDSDDPVLLLKYSGVSAEEVARLRVLFASQVRDGRTFYWAMTHLVNWFCRSWRRPLLLSLVILMLVFEVAAYWFVKSEPVVLFDALQVTGPFNLAATIRGGVIGVLGAYLVIWLFPSLVFAVGDGQDRYQVLKQWRFVLFSAVVVRMLFAIWMRMTT